MTEILSQLEALMRAQEQSLEKIRELEGRVRELERGEADPDLWQIITTGGQSGTFPTLNPTDPFYITRLGGTDEAVAIHVDDAGLVFQILQDENSAGAFGSVAWALGNQANQTPKFRIGDGRSGTFSDVFTFDVDTGDFYNDEWQAYTPGTITGWSTRTSEVFWYKKVGNLVLLHYHVAGSSDSVNTEFSLPMNRGTDSPAFQMDTLCRVQDLGAYYVGRALINNGGSLVQFTPAIDVAPGTWTASGTKRVIGQLFYQAS